MLLNKKRLEIGVVGTLTAAILCSGITTAVESSKPVKTEEPVVVAENLSDTCFSGVSIALLPALEKMDEIKAEEETVELAVEKADAEAVTATYISAKAEELISLEEKHPELAEAVTTTVTGVEEMEKVKWEGKLMADVEDFLYIRKKASSESEILGKLYPTSVAKVIKVKKEWTLIESGDVKGYVFNEYCVYDKDAYKNAKKVCDKVAVIKINGLNVRKDANMSAGVLTIANKGEAYELDRKAEKISGWVAVKVGDETGYVSASYANERFGTTKAKTLEQEQAEIKAAKKATKDSSAGAALTAVNIPVVEDVAGPVVEKSEPVDLSETTVYNDPVEVEVDDRTLLAAIIQCEAGGECYDGQVAVGAVVLNRMRSDRYPSTIYDVIYAPYQFSPTRNGSLARVLSNNSISESCYNAADDALNGTDPTGGATNFHVVDGHEGLIIEHHVFY